MNRTLFTLVISLLGVGLEAQPVSKKLFAGGDVGFYAASQEQKHDGGGKIKANITSITIMPSVGYFLSDRFAIGAQAGVISNTQKNDDSSWEKEVITQFNFAPFARYYLTSGTGGLFAQASVGIGIGRTKIAYESEETDKGDLSAFSIGITPGVYYYISPKVALEASVGWFGFRSEATKIEDVKRTENYFGFDIETTGLSVGFVVIL